MQNVQEDDLMNLQTFINYGTQALEGSSDSSVYQKLWFLVRDWKHSTDMAYGAQGGQQLLDEMFQVTSKTKNEQLRTDVQKCFEDIACYLMPYPGPQAHENSKFLGKLDELEKQFVDHLKQLVPLLLAPENLVVKKLGGHAITAKDLFSIFKSYVDVFKRKDLPKPMTVAESMAKANSQASLGAGLELYTKDMRTFLTANVAAELDQLEAEHDRMKKQAVNLYQQSNNLGRRIDEIFQQFEKQLENEIAARYNTEFKPLASSRCALKAAWEQYVTAMAAVAVEGRPAPQVHVLRSKHKAEQEQAFHCYCEKNEFGKTNEAIYVEYLELLKKKNNTHYEEQLMPASSSTAALEACKKRYLKVMNAFPMGEHKKQMLKQLKVCHDAELEEAVQDYEARNEPAMKNPDIFKKYLRLLEEEIDKAFTDEYLPIAALLDSWNLYIQAMEGTVEDAAVLADGDLSKKHKTEEIAAIDHYTAETKPSMNEKNVKEYKEHLEKALPELFKMIEDVNTTKRVVKNIGIVQNVRSGITTVLQIGFAALHHKVPIAGTAGSAGTSVVDFGLEKLVHTKKNVADAKKKYDEKKDTQVETWLSLWNTNKRKKSENL